MRPVSTNPVYAFFATPKSFGPFLLRMLLAAVFVFHGSQKAFGWFDGPGWSATLVDWSRPEGLNMPPWITALVIGIELASAISLFFGFFTRLFALAIMAVMTGAIWYVHAGDGIAASEYPFALLIVALSLVCLGAGRWSLDRAISGQLLPAIG
jgi:putative oxidoreductase